MEHAESISVLPGSGLPPSTRLLRTVSKSVAGEPTLGPESQGNSQKPFPLCEMPLMDLAEQLTLIELAMFRSTTLMPSITTTCRQLKNIFWYLKPGQSGRGSFSTSTGRKLTTREAPDTLLTW